MLCALEKPVCIPLWNNDITLWRNGVTANWWQVWSSEEQGMALSINYICSLDPQLMKGSTSPPRQDPKDLTQRPLKSLESTPCPQATGSASFLRFGVEIKEIL